MMVMDFVRKGFPMVSYGKKNQFRTAGIFAGIGGLELGLEKAGHQTVALCEVMEEALAVLDQAPKLTNLNIGKKQRPFEKASIFRDVRSKTFMEWFLDSNEFDLVTAGFPCQDLSQAGQTKGIKGENSGLIGNILDLVKGRPKNQRPKWLLLENVPFMRTLEGGRAMTFILSRLKELGYWWSYREVDARSFGLPQRRVRLFILACLEGQGDPRNVLLVDDVKGKGILKDRSDDWNRYACGFYWTEGNRGLGWAPDAVPTIKGGSGLGIPSPPAIMLTDRKIILPDIRDAERLQGFPAGWTKPATSVDPRSGRICWKLVGNAVSVNVAQWLGERLSSPGTYLPSEDTRIPTFSIWPKSAWSVDGENGIARVGPFPSENHEYESLFNFLLFEPKIKRKPLSIKAASGFLKRFERSNLMARKPKCRQTLIDVLKYHMAAKYPREGILLT